MKLVVQLISWNGARYVPHLFESLRKQTYKQWELLIVDNQSTDGMVEAIQKELVDFPVPARTIVNETNKGFAPAHNQALKESTSEYVLLLNQDMYLMPDCLEKMAQFLDEHSTIAAVSPRLMRWDFNKIGEGLEKSFSNNIDALGLKIFRNRRVIEQCTQQKWDEVKQSLKCHPEERGTSDVGIPLLKNSVDWGIASSLAASLIPRNDTSALAVFGVSGAFPMYRRTALNNVAFADGTFLDESYFMYKEDVDLAYRLQSAGFRAAVLLNTVAYHDRTGAGPKETNDWAAAKNKPSHNKVVRYHSYKNHLATLYKNEYEQNFILDFPWIVWYELKKFGYFLLFDRSVLRGFRELWKHRRELKIKRRNIKKLRKVNWQEIRRWF